MLPAQKSPQRPSPVPVTWVSQRRTHEGAMHYTSQETCTVDLEPTERRSGHFSGVLRGLSGLQQLWGMVGPAARYNILWPTVLRFESTPAPFPSGTFPHCLRTSSEHMHIYTTRSMARCSVPELPALEGGRLARTSSHARTRICRATGSSAVRPGSATLTTGVRAPAHAAQNVHMWRHVGGRGDSEGRTMVSGQPPHPEGTGLVPASRGQQRR